MEHIPGPDFPTGGIICGKTAIWQGYETGRSTVVVRSKTTIEERKSDRYRIIINDIPYQQTRDPVIKKIADVANEGRIPGISGVRDESDLKEPVRIVIDLKKDADPDVVLNQLYKFSPLQDSFSIILLALVDGKPRTLSLKEMLQEFVRHRVTVIRRRTQFLLARARKRKHTVQGLLLAHANIDEVIRVIRASKTQTEAKERLMQIKTPAAMLAAGPRRRRLRPVPAGTRRRRGILAHARPGRRHPQDDARPAGQSRAGKARRRARQAARPRSTSYLGILADEASIYAIIREDCEELARKHADARRTELSDEEIGEVDLEDLIEEETMVVSISHNGYIKRTPASIYRAQRRGGKGIKGAKADEDDPVEHLFVTSTHDYLLFFTNKGKVYWQKVYNLPQLSRESKGRAVVNLLNLAEDEKIADCRAVRDFDQPDHYLMMATRKGLVKKTELKAYSRPLKSGIIAIKLKEDDELIDVRDHQDRRRNHPRHRARHGDPLQRSRRPPDGPQHQRRQRHQLSARTTRWSAWSSPTPTPRCSPPARTATANAPPSAPTPPRRRARTEGEADVSGRRLRRGAQRPDEAEDEGSSSGFRYRTQNRGGKGLRDIKTTERNGPVIGIVPVNDDDELMMMTARGKIQRVKVSDFNPIGRNTQGVRIMSLDEGDTLAAIVRVPREEREEEATSEPESANE